MSKVTLWLTNADGEECKVTDVTVGNDLGEFISAVDYIQAMLRDRASIDVQICFNPEEGEEEHAG